MPPPPGTSRQSDGRLPGPQSRDHDNSSWWRHRKIRGHILPLNGQAATDHGSEQALDLTYRWKPQKPPPAETPPEVAMECPPTHWDRLRPGAREEARAWDLPSAFRTHRPGPGCGSWTVPCRWRGGPLPQKGGAPTVAPRPSAPDRCRRVVSQCCCGDRTPAPGHRVPRTRDQLLGSPPG